MALSNMGRRWPLLLSVAGIAALGSAALGQNAATFADQAEAGKAAYAQNCASCHGDNLQGLTGPTLRGNQFLGKWGAGALPRFSRRMNATSAAWVASGIWLEAPGGMFSWM